jgi:hypothetical protein
MLRTAQELPNLLCFGATEYMDSALTLPVLKELLLRGAPSAPRGRGRRVVADDDEEEDERERLRECAELEALDLTGCISATFVGALAAFADAHLSADVPAGAAVLPGLRRLGLRGAKSVPAHTLEALVRACPALTHLDASCTRAAPALLAALAAPDRAPLHALSLERCPQLTGAARSTNARTASSGSAGMWLSPSERSAGCAGSAASSAASSGAPDRSRYASAPRATHGARSSAARSSRASGDGVRRSA